MKKDKYLITGASGFVGQSLTENLLDRGASFRAVVRDKQRSFEHDVFCVDSIDATTNWSGAFEGVTCVVHLAGLAHMKLPKHELDLSKPYKNINTLGTLHLASSAAAAGVKRFVFISTIGVNGISNKRPFTVNDEPAPVDSYSRSKLDAEIGLKDISSKTGMEIVIIRPPLVYGRNAPGNFGKLLQLAKLSLPLPLGGIDNRRSLVAIDNLVDLIITCTFHPNAVNETFLVCDGEDISTSELLKMMINASGNTPMLFPVPQLCLEAVAKLFGKQDIVDRFCGSLQVDIEHTKNTLNWRPVISVYDAINKCFSKE